MRIYPTQDYMLVEILDPDYISQAGLLLPEHRKKVFKGKIIDIAKGKIGKNGERLPIDPDLQIGKVGMFSRFLGVGYEIDGKKLYWMKPDDFLCILPDESEPVEQQTEYVPVEMPDAEQVSRETQTFFVQGCTNDKDASPNRH